MNVTQKPVAKPWKVAAHILQPGEAILNGENNVCLVMRATQEDLASNRVRLAVLKTGGVYTVAHSTEYEVVDAEVVWSRRQAA
jgi:hypothetical protein